MSQSSREKWEYVVVGNCRVGTGPSGKMSGEKMSGWDYVIVRKCPSGKVSWWDIIGWDTVGWEIVEWEIVEWENVRVGRYRVGNCRYPVLIRRKEKIAMQVSRPMYARTRDEYI